MKHPLCWRTPHCGRTGTYGPWRSIGGALNRAILPEVCQVGDDDPDICSCNGDQSFPPPFTGAMKAGWVPGMEVVDDSEILGDATD